MEVGKLQVVEGEGTSSIAFKVIPNAPNNDNFYCIKFSYLHFPTINFMLVSKLYRQERFITHSSHSGLGQPNAP